MKVKINKCNGLDKWYKKYIGCTFNVKEESEFTGYYQLSKEDVELAKKMTNEKNPLVTGFVISKEDCEIYKEPDYNYEKIEQDTINRAIEAINSNLAILKDIGKAARDNDDFSYQLDYLYYSPAQKQVIANFKEVTSE